MNMDHVFDLNMAFDMDPPGTDIDSGPVKSSGKGMEICEIVCMMPTVIIDGLDSVCSIYMF